MNGSGERARTPEQERAIDAEDRDLLVEAGAGTGKTTTTVDRYMRLLGDGVDESGLLVFTFTDKAAAELRERVRGRRGAAAGIGSAWIGTFHSICRRILASHPVAAGIDPAFELIDDARAEALRRQAFELAFEEVAGSGGAAVAAAALFGEADLREAIVGAYEELRSRGVAEPDLPELEPSEPGPPLARLRDRAEEAAGFGNGSQQAKTRELIRLLGRSESEFGGITAAEIEPFCFSSTVEDLQGLCEAMEAARTCLIAAEEGDEMYARLRELLRGFGSAYRRLKRERTGLDFEDLQLLTLELLRRDDIGGLYDGRFAEIMVDEFQDTNPLQLELIEALRGEETTLFTVGDEMQSIYGFRHADVDLFRRRREDPSVEAVPLSANFRSDPEVIAAINEIGGRLDGQLPGAGNRFTPLRAGLAAAPCDRPRVEILLTEPEGWKQLDLGPLSPALEADGPGSEIVGRREAQALAVCRRIREHIDAGLVEPRDVAVLIRTRARFDLYRRALEAYGLNPYLIGGAGLWETREGGDVRSMAGLLANPLDDEALVACLTSAACGLSSDALWILRRASGPKRPLWPAFRALGSAGAGNGHGLDGLQDPDWLGRVPDGDVELARSFLSAVESVRGRLAITGPRAAIEAMIGETGYDLACLARDPDGSGLANLRRVVSLVGGYEDDGGRDLRGLLDWIGLSADVDDQSTAATADEESQVVRVMSIHKAKGLEFGMVCIPELERELRFRHDGALMIGKPPAGGGDPAIGMRLRRFGADSADLYGWGSIGQAAKAAQLEEEMRLLHVAMTRAKRHLILSGIAPARPVGSISDSAPIINRVLFAFDIDPDEPNDLRVPAAAPAEPGSSGEADDREWIVRVGANSATEERAAELRAGAAPIASAGEARVSGRPPLGPRPGPGRRETPLSFTALLQFVEDPVKFYAERVLRVGAPDDPEAELDGYRAAGRDATAFGRAVHALLEASSRSRWALPGQDRIEAALVAEGSDGADGRSGRAAGMVEAFVDSDLRAELDGARLRAEVPLILRVGGRTIRGSIDLLAEWPDRPPLLIDYKTNRLERKDLETEAGRYRLQGELYGLAVARSGGFETVETAFAFLERPESPIRRTLSGDDFETAEAELRRLIASIDGYAPVEGRGQVDARAPDDAHAQVDGRAPDDGSSPEPT